MISLCDPVLDTTLKLPMRSPYNPKFFAKLLHTMNILSVMSNLVMTYLSISNDPDANPNYAMSISGRMLGLFFSVCTIRSHCCGVGSTPVGLCPHGCNTTTLGSFILLRSSSIPSISSFICLLS